MTTASVLIVKCDPYTARILEGFFDWVIQPTDMKRLKGIRASAGRMVMVTQGLSKKECGQVEEVIPNLRSAHKEFAVVHL